MGCDRFRPCWHEYISFHQILSSVVRCTGQRRGEGKGGERGEIAEAVIRILYTTVPQVATQFALRSVM